MTDLFIESLKKQKQTKEFDINRAYVCAILSTLVYEPKATQLLMLRQNGFQNIKSITRKKSNILMATLANDLYISFMGSDFSNINDLIDNINAEWAQEGISKVHKGYKTHIDLFWPIIEKYTRMHVEKQIIITGHSMGGACGQIGNYRLSNSIGYYFGSTRVVDDKIANSTTSTVYHIRHRYDIVPFYPLRFFGFARIGKSFVIKNNLLLAKPPKWYHLVNSAFQTILYLIMVGVTKISKGKNHFINKALVNHQIDNYIKSLEAVIKATNQQ